ncbi:MAG: protein kinase [Actinophytocola sp.]|uniref:serine/threonine-protein kinase n=1 Tax=Actinophytocola sp. TaxID=1872138 RepID=UPI001322D135|nr:serine/threonine-protein kinase [Actinophytocola sp.]MPZ81318.1 protein kinase [Actinophytocola sp.]
MRSGQLIANRYRLVELVGSGGSGLVWLAVDEVEHRQVALKRPHSSDGPAVRAELEREASVAARVRHPNAIRVFEVVGDGDESWLVMEYFPAKNLRVVLRERGPLEPDEVAGIGVQVAQALAAIHDAEVVHRDVTPNNILVDDEGTAKVTDYGISAHRAQTMTSSGKVSGTAVYLSPEVANGSGAKAPSDMFSLGASLFAAVEGAPPFGFGDPDLVLARIRAGRRAPTTRAGALEPVLDALLDPDRDARPTAAEAAAMLEHVVAGRPVPAWERASRTTSRRRWPMVAGAAAVVVAVVLGVIMWSPWRTSAGNEPLRTVLGDPKTAEPCALVDPEATRRFGPGDVDPAYGNYNRCEVLIDPDSEKETGVVLELIGKADPDEPAPADGTVEMDAPEADDEGGCDVTITLADLNRIDVNARPRGDEATADMCDMAKAAADRAYALLPPDELARRAEPFDAASLANAKACDLVDEGALSRVPGLGGGEAEVDVGYGDWMCEWTGRAATMRARVIFNRNTRLSADDGEPLELAGHDAYREPEGYGEDSCLVHVVHRPVVGENGDELDELATVIVDGDESMDTLCATVTDLATAVATNLPPT